MKITDIVSQKQQKQQVAEAPVGMLKRAGLGIASKLGSQTAKGALDTATMANGLRKQFDYYLGQSGQKPNSDAIIAFLGANGFPTAGAEAAIKQASLAAGNMPAKDIRQTLGIGKNTDGPMATPNQPDRVEPTLDDPEQSADQQAEPEVPKADSDEVDYDQYDEPAYKRKGMKNPAESIDELSRIAHLAGTTYKPVQEVVIDEVDLKNSTVDSIIKAAVQDILKANMGQKLDAMISGQGAASPQAINKAGGNAAADDAAGGDDSGQGFIAGLKRGIKGGNDAKTQTKGNLNYGKLTDMLPGVDPNQLKKAITGYMSGTPLTREYMGVMSSAFGEILKMDPTQKTQVLQILKAMSAR
jgi:hypothetical protein